MTAAQQVYEACRIRHTLYIMQISETRCVIGLFADA